jgi:hypothetical protein
LIDVTKTGLRLSATTSVCPSLCYYPFGLISQRIQNASVFDPKSRFGKFKHSNVSPTFYFRLSFGKDALRSSSDIPEEPPPTPL